MRHPAEDSAQGRAAAQYTRAVGALRERQIEALAWGWFDHWRDLCQLEDRLVRAADEEIYREVPITED